MRAPATITTLCCVTLLSAGASGLAARAQQAVDTANLDEVEDLSESLANDLLALSLAARDKDRAAIRRYFDDPLDATPIPTIALAATRVAAWAVSREWRIDAMAPVGRNTFVAGLERLLERFPSIDDVRFKVKEAEFQPSGTSGGARIWFFIVGRDTTGRREWLTAWARIDAHKEGEGNWRIRRFRLESFSSMTAERELFSEVALPAGVRHEFPPFGTEPNDTVAAHGVAVADVNGDGLLDVATTGVAHNQLYLNDGSGAFRDASDETFVSLTPAASGPLFLDYDNDGDADLFLAVVGSQVLLENRLVPDGTVHFVDRSLEAGVSIPANGFSAAAADINGDGWQDIYVASYNRYGIVMPNAWHRATNGTPNLLFVNQGDGTFREAAQAWDVRDSRWSYAATFADIDADGDQDLYVANDFGENGLYVNEGDGFREAAVQRGVLDPGNGMGVAFGDYDNDGDLDLHVTNMSSTAGNRILSRLYPDTAPEELVLKKLAVGNSLYANDGSGNFADVTRDVGGIPAGWAFGGGFIDVDNDGWEDMYSPNGFISGKTMEDT
jgi:hypothetical protein